MGWGAIYLEDLTMPDNRRYHPDFLEIACDRTESSDTTKIVSVGALAALFAFATLDPVTGFAIAAYTLYKAWKDEGNAGDAEEYLQQNTAPAPFLSRQELALYIRHFGIEQALKEIDEAIGNGIKVSSAARRLARHHDLGIKSPTCALFLEKKQNKTISGMHEINEDMLETSENATETDEMAKSERISVSPAIEELIDAPAVAFVGEMGSGKTSKLGWLIGRHVSRGDRVLVVNPFVAFGEFEGVEVFGRGNDFDSASQGVKLFIDEVKSRIEKRAREAYDPLRDRHWHLALDEMTNYSSKLPDKLLGEFWEIVLQGLRQANTSVSMVSHGFTQRMLGGSEALRGLSDAIERQFVVVLSKSRANPDYVPGKGLSPKIPEEWGILQRWDGTELKRDRVECPRWMQPPAGYDFRSLASKPAMRNDSETSLKPPETETPPETLKRHSFGGFQDFQKPETRNETAETGQNAELETETKRLKWQRVQLLKSEGHSQVDILKIVWRVKPGGSKAYQRARDELAALESEFGNKGN